MSKKFKGPAQTTPTISQRLLSSTLPTDRRDFEVSLASINSSRHLGSAVKQLAPTDLHSPLIASKNSSGSNVSGMPSVQLKRSLGGHHSKVWESWLAGRTVIESIAFAAVLGSVIFSTIKLSGARSDRMRNASNLSSSQENIETSSSVWTTDSSFKDNLGRSRIKGSGIGSRLNELVEMVKMQFRKGSDIGYPQSSCLPDSLSTSNMAVNWRSMPFEEAEALVKQWQVIKAEALGAGHEAHNLSEALDKSMLVQWQALADVAKVRSCYWRFV